MRYQVPRHALEAYMFAAKSKDLRHNINYVCIESEHTGVAHAIATDGHRMLHVAWPERNGPKEPILLQREALEKFMKSYGKRPPKSVGDRDHDFFLHDRGEGKVEISVSGGPTVEVNDGRDQATFPDWRQVVPKAADEKDMQKFPQKFGLNIGYLIDLEKYMRACKMDKKDPAELYHNGKPKPPVEISYNDKAGLAPILFTMRASHKDGGEIRPEYIEYILMPMRY